MKTIGISSALLWICWVAHPTFTLAAARQSSPFFPIGLWCIDDYHWGDVTGPPFKTLMDILKEFPEISRAGFNLIHAGLFDCAAAEDGNTNENARIFLDAAQKSGLKVAMGLSYGPWLWGRDVWNDNLDLILERIRALKDNPALFAWVFYNDLRQGGVGGKDQKLFPDPKWLRKIRRAIKEIDAVHPLIVGLPGKVDQDYEYRDVADIYMPNNMPVGLEVIPPDLPQEWESHPEDVGKAIDDIYKVVGPSRKVIAHVQTHNLANVYTSWDDRMPKELGRYPTMTEMRYMVYDALIHGSQGVFFVVPFLENRHRPLHNNFGGCNHEDSYLSPRRNSKQWKIMASLATELKELTPILTAPQSQVEVTADSADGVAEFLLKEHRGKLYLIAVNSKNQKGRVRFAFSKPISSIKVYNESRSILPQGNSFVDDFDGYGVHLYKVE